MVPYANCLRNNRFVADGEQFDVAANMLESRLNFHGSGWTLPWHLKEHGDNRAVLLLDSTDRDPVFVYRAYQTFELNAERLSVALSVENSGKRRMPFSLGLHPWFARHGVAKVRFAADQVWLTDPEGQARTLAFLSASTDYRESRELPREFTNKCYTGWDGFAEIHWPNAGRVLKMRGGMGLGFLMVHVPANQPETFCLEPQSVPPCGFDGLETGMPPQGVFLLEPGERAGVMVSFEVYANDRAKY